MKKNRVFLVDDELPVLEGLSLTIKKTFSDLEICGTAGDGRSAVEGIAETRPDIIIMDVRVPGLSGLEALRELRSLVPDSVFILLTAYERFDLAREAFSLGVYQYLLKPVNRELLVETIGGALSRLNAARANALRSASVLEKLELAKPLVEAGFVYSLLSGSPAPLTDACAEWLALKTGGKILGHFAALYRQNDPASPYHPLFPDEEALVKREITNRLDCVAGSETGGLLPLFIRGGVSSRSKEAIEDALKSAGNPQIRYALGKAAQGELLKDSWRELVAVIAGGNNPPDRGGSPEPQTIIDAAKSSSFQAVQAGFTRWSSGPAQNGDRAILAGALAALAGGSGEEILSAGQTQLRLGVKDSKDAEQAAYLVSLTLESLSRSGREDPGEAGMDRRVSAAIRFIAGHYGKPISLDDAAQKAGVSPAHLSRIFCSETGASFSKHLAGQRIRRACRELSSGIRSIKELAVLCGFSNANYFSRAFKKATGITPSEYARKHGRTPQ